jgi:small membrane protein
MTPIQIIILLFAFFALTRVFLRLKKREMGLYAVVFWSFVWICVVLVALFPQLSSIFAQKLGLSSGTGLLVYVSILLLFYLVYRLYVFQQSQDQKITFLVRAMALKRARRK